MDRFIHTQREIGYSMAMLTSCPASARSWYRVSSDVAAAISSSFMSSPAVGMPHATVRIVFAAATALLDALVADRQSLDRPRRRQRVHGRPSSHRALAPRQWWHATYARGGRVAARAGSARVARFGAAARSTQVLARPWRVHLAHGRSLPHLALLRTQCVHDTFVALRRRTGAHATTTSPQAATWVGFIQHRFRPLSGSITVCNRGARVLTRSGRWGNTHPVRKRVAGQAGGEFGAVACIYLHI